MYTVFYIVAFKGKLLYYFDHRNYKPLCGLNSLNHAIISVTTIISVCYLQMDHNKVHKNWLVLHNVTVVYDGSKEF